jgi:hypothetical protein
VLFSSFSEEKIQIRRPACQFDAVSKVRVSTLSLDLQYRDRLATSFSFISNIVALSCSFNNEGQNGKVRITCTYKKLNTSYQPQF